jgi:hypothetical protein
MKAFNVALVASLSNKPMAISGFGPVSVSGSASLYPTLTTSPVTAYVTGGVAPYTYEVEFQFGDPDITADVFSNNATFSATATTAPITYSAAFKFKVTDLVGSVAYSNDIDVTIEFTSP